VSPITGSGRVIFVETPRLFGGPAIVAYRGIADDPDRVASLDRDLAALARRYNRGSDTSVMDWGYSLFTARTRI
jgi:hypothetical protein